MPVQPTYPGVYTQEIPSGVRTITGVSTSVAAFLGAAKRGPIDIPITITSYSEFEKKFGGITRDLELGYSVKQFFLNGGTQAIIVRLAPNATAAETTLLDINGGNTLTIKALNKGSAGENITIRIDYKTTNPDSLFNLTVNYNNINNPAEDNFELFRNLSMDSQHNRYVQNIINDSSNLIIAERDSNINFNIKGKLTSGDNPAPHQLPDATHNTFRIKIDGAVPLDVPLDHNVITNFTELKDAITAINGITCSVVLDTLKIVSDTPGENSSVEILPGLTHDASTHLKLTLGSGAKIIDGSSAFRPKEAPDRSTLTSDTIIEADIQALDLSINNNFLINIDNGSAVTVSIGSNPIVDTTDLTTMLPEIAERIQNAVRSLRPGSPPFDKCTCIFDGTDKLVLSPGSRGSQSSILVTSGSGKLANALKLISGNFTGAPDVKLLGGSEDPITDANRYVAYTGNEAQRTGIYALEGVDLFNIMCLPAVVNNGIISVAEAYCKSRRAFLIVDAHPANDKPDEMLNALPGVPKSDSAAVYYPD